MPPTKEKQGKQRSSGEVERPFSRFARLAPKMLCVVSNPFTVPPAEPQYPIHFDWMIFSVRENIWRRLWIEGAHKLLHLLRQAVIFSWAILQGQVYRGHQIALKIEMIKRHAVFGEDRLEKIFK